MSGFFFQRTALVLRLEDAVPVGVCTKPAAGRGALVK
jgi:hypothetical protein